jgi:hypothetical protein
VPQRFQLGAAAIGQAIFSKKEKFSQEWNMSQFSFKNVGHFFATVAGDIVKGARAVASVMLKAEKVEPEIEALSGIFFPQAVELERGAFALLGMAAQAVTEAGDAAGQNGINITLDQQLIADIKALIGAIEAYAKSAGVSKPAPGAVAAAK